MSAIDLNLEDRAIAAEIEQCIGALAESRSRRRIATAWQNGWLLGDHAMELLIGLDLIEAPQVADDD